MTVGHRLMAAGEPELALKAYLRGAGEVGINADVLSSIGSANLALGRWLEDAVALSKSFVWEALDAGQHRRIGNGNGPVDHHFALRKPSREH